MSLLRETDPHYWLAKLAATPLKSDFTMDEFSAVVSAAAQMYQVALDAGINAYSHSGVIVFSQGDVDAALQPLIYRADAFLQHYTAMLQSSKAAQAEIVIAPDLRNDCIELFTYVSASIDQLRQISSDNAWSDWMADLAVSWSQGSQKIFGAITSTAEALYTSLTTGTQLLFWTVVIGGSSLLIYGGIRLVKRETGDRPQYLRARSS